MFGKQSPEAKGSQPAKACAEVLESKPVKPVKAIRFFGDSSKKSGSEQIADTQRLVSVSSSGIVHASELSEVEEVEEPIVKKPAKVGASKKHATIRQQPARQRQGNSLQRESLQS